MAWCNASLNKSELIPSTSAMQSFHVWCLRNNSVRRKPLSRDSTSFGALGTDCQYQKRFDGSFRRSKHFQFRGALTCGFPDVPEIVLCFRYQTTKAVCDWESLTDAPPCLAARRGSVKKVGPIFEISMIHKGKRMNKERRIKRWYTIYTNDG